jgi:hypothetical protein
MDSKDSTPRFTPLPDAMQKTTKRRIYRVAKAMDIRRRACMNKPELWRAVNNEEKKIRFFNSPTPKHTPSPPPKRIQEARPSSPLQVTSPKLSPSPQVRTSPIPQVRTSPIPQVRTSPIPQVRTSPIPQVRTSPIPQVTLKIPPARFELHNKPVKDIGSLFLMPACNIKYRGVCMGNDTMEDIKRAIRRYLRLPFTDTNISTNHLFYHEARDVFGVECLITPIGNTNALKAIKLLYWVELGLTKDLDGYRSVQVHAANKFVERPPGFTLIL